MMTVIIIFRNGFALDVICDSYTVTYNRDGSLGSIRFYNVAVGSDDPGWIDPKDVICVYRKGDETHA